MFYRNCDDAQVSGWGFATMESGKVGREEAKRGLGHGVAACGSPAGMSREEVVPEDTGQQRVAGHGAPN